MNLSIRLQAIADMVPTGARLADIGTDHAYLPLYLISTGKIAFAVAGEVNQGPYDSAKSMLAKLDIEEKIKLRFGNGLAVVHPGEIDTVVIAGMGGNTIIDILSAQPEVTSALQTLILQPMIASSSVRHWLLEHNWQIVAEKLVKEDILYEIIVAQPGRSEKIEPILLDVGPVLWKQRQPLLREHLAQLIEKTQRIIDNIKLSKEYQNLPKYQESIEKLQQLEDKLSCL